MSSSILYQRGLYPEEDFKMVTKYGMKVLTSTNPELTAYISKITQQLKSIKQHPLNIVATNVNLVQYG
jgi:hypothetical protein